MATTLADIAGELAPPGVGSIEVTGITADSRKVAPGFMFAALPGTETDGAHYIAQAIENGAVAIVGPRTLTPGIAGYVPVIRVDDPRKTLSIMAAHLHRGQPANVVAVTGTNGKTSVAAFVRQIWQLQGINAASMGTTGIEASYGVEKLAHTTPDPVQLHHSLARMAFHGVTHLALEASSHGLMQRRLDGVRLLAGAFTNLSRDHLDYHATFEDYFAAKMILFEELLPAGATAVVDADDPMSDEVGQICRNRGLRVVSVGKKGRDIRLLGVKGKGASQAIKVRVGAKTFETELPLVGAFQVSNALVAAGLAMAGGVGTADAIAALAQLKGAKGRLEQVAELANGARVFVDYAHTPDALDTALKALKPYAKGKLAVVFGAGGDRDAGKRSQMGEAAAATADRVYVTDDNPRSEEPQDIRRQVMEGCPDAIDAGGRAKAIETAMAELGKGDILLVAGKGHETGQEIAGEVHPFSDHDVVRELAGQPRRKDDGLWTSEALVAATGGELLGDVDQAIGGVSIDSRTVEPGELFFAIKGDSMDGHAYAADALKAGAALAVVSDVDKAMTKAGAVLKVQDTLKALEDLGRAARARSRAKIIAVTGSVGKTTTKDALRLALSACGKTHASVSSFNNHWGVPLSLARMPRDTEYGVFEIGMNHPGEITPLTEMVKPHVAIITQIAESHLGFFKSLDEIADAKAEIFSGMRPDGAAVINRDTPYFERLRDAARAQGLERIVGFGADDNADVRLDTAELHSSRSRVAANVLGEELSFEVGMPGAHVVMNTLAVLAAVKLSGADLVRSAQALAHMKPASGRGVRYKLRTGDGWFTLIDESYNANPASMRAALQILQHTSTGQGGRRIAVLGDMLELGENASRLHEELAQAVDAAGIDAVYTCGPEMRHLHEALPQGVAAAHAVSSAELESDVLGAVRAGDAVMVKGSLGSRMGPLVQALRDRFGDNTDTGHDDGADEGAN